MKVLTSALTFKTLLRHYAEWELTHRDRGVKAKVIRGIGLVSIVT